MGQRSGTTMRKELQPPRRASYDWEERASILEFEAGYSRPEAEREATRQMTAPKQLPLGNWDKD